MILLIISEQSSEDLANIISGFDNSSLAERFHWFATYNYYEGNYDAQPDFDREKFVAIRSGK